MGQSTIEWTDKTWNPIRGCSMAKGSELGGCLNCYAARFAARNLPEMKSPTTGEPFARLMPSGPRWTGKVEVIEKALPLPLHWRKPARIFVNSMSDMFHESLSFQDIARVFRVICEGRGRHTYQILTKRASRMLEWLLWARVNEPGWFSSETGLLDLWNVWLGVSVEDQKTADERIPLLWQAPAAFRFVSYEPALGPIGFARHLPHIHGVRNDRFWIIIGGESGPGARRFDITWAREVIEQCKDAGVACFVKQLGARPYSGRLGTGTMPDMALKSRKGGDMSEWPVDLRVREFPV